MRRRLSEAMGALYSLVPRSWLTSGRLLVTGYGQGAPCGGVSLSASLSATVPSGRGSGFLHLLPAQALRCGFQKLRRDFAAASGRGESQMVAQPGDVLYWAASAMAGLLALIAA